MSDYTPEQTAERWTCFHCGETFTTQGSARDHFGAVEGAVAGCLIDRVAIEEGGKPERGRGLLMALRKSEAALTAERQKVRELREWHRVNVQEGRMAGSVAALTSAEESARFLGEVQAHNDSLSKLDALGLTGSEPQ